ncbi:MAG TPA: cupin domain-containing protein [Pseudonocardiaceae bacterium]|jgi:quercetin dioxygenase-like cupin family protein|nr:cupin domain-containing protein [Pseudonocardiaceae bacterium]
MIIVRGDAEGRPSQKRGATFTGEVWADPILPGVDGVTIATVVFTPGARTFWHHHERGQILQVIAGDGIVCPKDGEPARLRAGDTVWVPPGEQHWHGAAPDSLMSHIATSLGTTQWADEVTEAEFASANDMQRKTSE